jgi:FkbM family methyltransferase
MLQNLRVIDIGARYGLHPSLRPLLGRADIDLFEPDPAEFNRLVEQYRHESRVVVHQNAIGRESSSRPFELRQHRALSGFAELATDRVRQNFQRRGILGMAPERVIRVSVTPLDKFLNDKPTFIKVDAEGSESEVLESAGKRQRCIVAVRVSSNYQPLWRGDTTFTGIGGHLQRCGFEFLRSESRWNDYEYGELALPTSTAKPVSCDGLWFRDPALRTSPEEHVATALFLYLHGAHGLALHALMAGAELERLHLEDAPWESAGGLLYAYLIQHLLIARTLPYRDYSRIDDCYERVCGAKFPDKQRAFEVLNAVGLIA